MLLQPKTQPTHTQSRFIKRFNSLLLFLETRVDMGQCQLVPSSSTRALRRLGMQLIEHGLHCHLALRDHTKAIAHATVTALLEVGASNRPLQHTSHTTASAAAPAFRHTTTSPIPPYLAFDEAANTVWHSANPQESGEAHHSTRDDIETHGNQRHATAPGRPFLSVEQSARPLACKPCRADTINIYVYSYNVNSVIDGISVVVLLCVEFSECEMGSAGVTGQAFRRIWVLCVGCDRWSLYATAQPPHLRDNPSTALLHPESISLPTARLDMVSTHQRQQPCGFCRLTVLLFDCWPAGPIGDHPAAR